MENTDQAIEKSPGKSKRIGAVADRSIQLLDCTLRDGGYYTSWDFEEDLTGEYFEHLERLPVEFLEIGYRSPTGKNYAGAFFYLPEFLLKKIRQQTSKKLVVMLNEKEVHPGQAKALLEPCQDTINMVRLAVAPTNFTRALDLAARVKEMGFKVSINMMYACKWGPEPQLDGLDQVADYFYVVDSYGGLFPEQVMEIFRYLRKNHRLALGFHGHNNLELALANSLAAMEAGADIVDATIGGMGRGAGNLKTELLLSVLHKKQGLKVDFDALYDISIRFQELRECYQWGTNLPYMLSGEYSLAQDAVIAQVRKRYFSLNSIVSRVSEKKHGEPLVIPEFRPERISGAALVAGGGPSVRKYAPALREYLEKHPEVPIIFVSSKNVALLDGLPNPQFHIIPGREGKRLEKVLGQQGLGNRRLVIPPREVAEDNYLPAGARDQIFRLPGFKVLEQFPTSATAQAFEAAFLMGAKEILLVGYDGYEKHITREELELFAENESVFQQWQKQGELYSLTPGQYDVEPKSLFSLL